MEIYHALHPPLHQVDPRLPEAPGEEDLSTRVCRSLITEQLARNNGPRKGRFLERLKFVKTSDGNSPPRQTTTLATGEWGTVCVLWRENTIELP